MPSYRAGEVRLLGILPLVLMAMSVALAAPTLAAVRFDAPLLTQVPGIGYRPEPPSFSIADLNHDGSLDVVVPDESLTVLIGRGDGTFAPPIGLATPGMTPYTAVADFDGDGAPDIACGGYLYAGVLFGDGSGANWSRTDLAATNVIAIAAADFDGDGRPDVATLTRDFATPPHCAVCAYLSRPGRAFAVVTGAQDSLLGPVASIHVADMNRDGRLDLVVSFVSSKPGVVVFLGRGDGTFVAHAIDDTEYPNVFDMDVADANDDGLLDVVVAESWQMILYPGLGDGTFGAPIELFPPSIYLYSVAVADVNGDGIPDLVTADLHGSITVRAGLGGGAFGPAHENRVEHTLNPIAIADMNGDERPDVVALSTDEYGMMVAVGDGRGGFGQRTVDVPLPEAPQGITSGDFDGDGVPDLALNWSTSLEVLLSRPGRVFTYAPSTSTDPFADGPALADFNEDGYLDIAFSLRSGDLEVFLGRGDGTFTAPTVLAQPGGAYPATAADLNGDGHVDLVFGSSGAVRALLGRGDGTFDAPIDSPIGAGLVAGGANSSPIATGDFNGDHVLDLNLVAYKPTTSEFFQLTMLGDGSGAFIPGPLSPLSGSGWMCGLTADLDLDARADVISTDGCCQNVPRGPLSGLISTRLQQPDGLLGPPILSRWPALNHIGIYAEEPRVADIGADGVPGIVFRNQLGFGVMTGDGAGHFQVENGYAGRHVSSLILADLDGDGYVDAAAGGYGSNGAGVSIYFGRDATPPFATILFPLADAELGVGQTVPIRWSATDDVGVQSVDLFVSRHGGSGPFEHVALGLSNSGEFDWTVSAPFSDSVMFKLVARDAAGNVGRATSASPMRIVEAASVGGAAAGTSSKLAIASLAPNPARSSLSISFSLPRAGRARLALYDLQGRMVAKLMDEDRAQGAGTYSWNTAAARLHSGLYFLRLDAGGHHVVGRLALTDQR